MKVPARLIRLCLEKQVPFVCFRQPGSRDFKVWIQRSGSMQLFESFDQIGNESGFVYAPFHRKTNYPVVFFTGEIRVEEDQADDYLLKDLGEMEPLYGPITDPLPPEITKSEYLYQANLFIRSFGKHLKKAVLSRVMLRKNPEKFHLVKYLQTLAANHPDAFIHLINMPGNGLWLGATPELLYRREQNHCFTEALAGTQSFSDQDTVQWEPKETEEQEMVTRYIKSLMHSKGIQSYTVEDPKTIRAGHLLHRKTGFRFVTGAGFDESNFIHALHPTPAVCGLPKAEALELILRTEKHNREYYAGFCGPVNQNQTTELFVNLRCMKLFESQLAVYTGGGLTAKSVPQKEWEETELKANTLLSIM
jgi:isochorismate synthase